MALEATKSQQSKIMELKTEIAQLLESQEFLSGQHDILNQGCRNPGVHLPQMIWLHPLNNLIMVYICIPPNNLTLVCIWALDDVWSSFLVFTWIRGKKSSIFGEHFFFIFGLY